MNDNNENNGNGSKIFIIIIIAVLILLAIWFIFFRGDNNNNTTTPNIYQATNEFGNAVGNTVNIVDENAKMLYDRVKKGITLDGKLIEVPASYMKKITDKVSAKGYKMTADTKKAIDSKLDEIEATIRSEGKTDIKDLSKESQDKIKGIAKDIENML